MRIFRSKLFCYSLILSIAFIFMVIALIYELFMSESSRVALWARVSDLGTESIYIIAGLAIYYLYNPYIGFSTILSLVLSGSLNSMVKEWLALPRPPNPKIPAEGYGFPSGHAQNTTVFWGTLSLLSKNSCLIILTIFLVAIISYSRIYLGVHYTHDVLGGIFIGILLIVAIYYLLIKIKSIFARDAALLAVSLIFSLLSYLYTRDTAVLKLSAVSLGLSIHIILLSKKHYIDIIKSFLSRSAGFITSIIIIFTMLYGARGLVSQSLVATYIIYIALGILIPVIYDLFRSFDKRLVKQ